MLQVPLYFQLEPCGTAVDRRAGRRHCWEVEVGRTAGSSAAVFANCSAAACGPGGCSLPAAAWRRCSAAGGQAVAVPQQCRHHWMWMGYRHTCTVTTVHTPARSAVFRHQFTWPFPGPVARPSRVLCTPSSLEYTIHCIVPRRLTRSVPFQILITSQMSPFQILIAHVPHKAHRNQHLERGYFGTRGEGHREVLEAGPGF
jgi:hypothetical protein